MARAANPGVRFGAAARASQRMRQAPTVVFAVARIQTAVEAAMFEALLMSGKHAIIHAALTPADKPAYERATSAPVGQCASCASAKFPLGRG